MKEKRARARARDCEFRIRFRQPLFDASVVFVEVVFFIVITRVRARALHGAFEKKKTREKLSYLFFFFSDEDVTTCAFWIQKKSNEYGL